MSNDLFHCVRCGAPLATPDSVCEQCDRDLTVPVAKPDSAIGKYRCPECTCRFEEPNWYSEKAPWHLLGVLKTKKCPQCGCLLRDHALIAISFLYVFFMIFLFQLLFEDNWRWPIGVLGILGSAVSLFFSWHYIRSEHRYASAKRHKPAKQ